MLPIEHTVVLLVPAMAACALVGWWAGGRASLAFVWIAAAAYLMMRQPGTSPGEPGRIFDTLVRGWSLLVAGAFGVVCLFGRMPAASLLPRALVAIVATFAVGLVMTIASPVDFVGAAGTVKAEFALRNQQTVAALNETIRQYPEAWKDMMSGTPGGADAPAEIQKALTQSSSAAASVWAALLALQSLAALALAWAVYHRLSRARIGPPVSDLRDFRFSDQLVWGLIAGLALLLVPIGPWNYVGRNLTVFFAALYAIRGLGVLSAFLPRGGLPLAAAIGFVFLWIPLLRQLAAVGFMVMVIAAIGLGLGDTWADWRRLPEAIRRPRR
jgi:hypothetical protein